MPNSHCSVSVYRKGAAKHGLNEMKKYAIGNGAVKLTTVFTF